MSVFPRLALTIRAASARRFGITARVWISWPSNRLKMLTTHEEVLINLYLSYRCAEEYARRARLGLGSSSLICDSFEASFDCVSRSLSGADMT